MIVTLKHIGTSLPCHKGRAWAAVSTEGLLIYSLDRGVVFDPFDLSVEVTPDSIMAALREKQYSIALVMSFRLNEHDLKVRVMEAIPIQDGKEEGGGWRGEGDAGYDLVIS